MHHTLTTQNTRRDRSPRRATMLSLLLAMLLTAVPTAGAAADAELKATDLEIPAQALIPALDAFAEYSGLQLLYSAELAEGKTTRGVSGRLTPEQALQTLLEGTGVSYRFVDPGTVTLARPDPLAELVARARRPIDYAQATQPAPDTPKAPAKKSEEGPTVLPEMTITASPLDDTGYSVFNATTATKTDTPIMETPVSIQVIPRQVIEDQKATRIKEVLENVSSVRPQPSINSGTGFIIRGFLNNETYRNGLLAESNEFDSFNVESIDVLKGPASVLYGRIEPGGIINITTKRPLDVPYYSLEQQFGSYDFYRTQWDATGPITSDRSLLYRFTGAYQNSDSFRDFNFVDRIAVNPSLTWRPSAATEVDLEVEGLRQEYQVDRALFAIGDRPAPIPIGRSFIDPNDPVDYLSKVHLGFNLTHKFNAAWTLRNRFLATWSDWTNTSVKPANPFTVAAFLDPSTGNRLYPRNIFFQESIEEKYATNLDLTGKFQLGQTRHEVLAGFDYLRSLPTYHIQGNFVQPIPGLEIDIFNPQYGIDPAVYAQALAVNFPPGGNFNQFTNDFYGVYFQDHITLWDRLHILGGGRYDWAETGRGRGASFAEAEANLPSDIRKDEAFSPRVGVLYQPWYWLSVYGNWATSFGANNGLSATGETFDPEIGEQFEAGFKTEVFDQRVSTTLAFYHLTRQNILTPNFITPDPFDSIAVGEARSRGIELDMSGQITEEWNLIGSYAYTDARVTLDNGGLQGNLLSNVPEHAGSLFLKYDFKQHAPLNGLSLGFGAFVVGDRAGDPENTFKLPGYTRLDTFAAYRWKIGSSTVTAQLNVRNLLDKEYFESTDPFSNAPPRVGIYPGAPLTVLGSIRVEF